MKLGLALVLLAGLIIALSVVLQRDDTTGPGDEQAPGDSASAPGIADSPAARDDSDDAEYLQFVPDKETNLTVQDPTSETPPRTVAGLPAVKEAVELPVVDPATLPFDPEVGRIDVDAPVQQQASGPGVAIAPATESLGAPEGQFFETDDGPLAGMIPAADTAAPGPAARLPDTDSSAILDDAVSIDTVDASGPGTPADPASQATAPPMYTLPDENTEIPDPDPAAAGN